MRRHISLIIPVFNAEKYLESCVDSITVQANDNVEIILVDDGSTDNSGKICDELSVKYNYITAIHKANEGVSIARNTGIEHSSGELICFVDADDWVDKNYISTIENNIKDFDLLFFSNYRKFTDNSITGQFHRDVEYVGRKKVEEGIIKMKYENPTGYEYWGFTWNKCFRSKFIKEHNIRFIAGLNYKEDEVFTNEYSKHINSFKFISTPIYFYRENKSGLTLIRKKPEDYIALARELDRSTNSESINTLFCLDKSRVLDFYLNAVNEISIKQYYEIWEFYHKNFPPCISNNRTGVFLRYNKILSTIIFMAKKTKIYLKSLAYR